MFGIQHSSGIRRKKRSRRRKIAKYKWNNVEEDGRFFFNLLGGKKDLQQKCHSFIISSIFK
jgi:hypothetical protein